MVFLCENNQYAPVDRRSAHDGGRDRGLAPPATACRACTIDGNDVARRVRGGRRGRRAGARAATARRLIEAMTYRWGDHSMRANLRDTAQGRRGGRVAGARPDRCASDTVVLEGDGASDAIAARGASREAVHADDRRGGRSSQRAAPEPDVDDDGRRRLRPARGDARSRRHGGARELRSSRRSTRRCAQEMERDARVFVIGEDVGLIGGIFGVTRGLLDRFGARARARHADLGERPSSAPASAPRSSGLRPVVEDPDLRLHHADDGPDRQPGGEVPLHAGRKPDRAAGRVRGPQGGGIRLAAQHSQSLEAWFAHVPGPGRRRALDAVRRQGAADRGDPRRQSRHLPRAQDALSRPRAPVPEAPYAIPIGKAAIKRAGTDVTVVATQAMVDPRAPAAADLERRGSSVEVIDPRTLAAARRDDDHRVRRARPVGSSIAHEAVKRGGFGAEVAAMVCEQALD